MTVSVVIPAYNAEKTLPRLLKSLAPIDPKTTEIIIVDDASTDSTREVARSFSQVTFLQQPQNKGVAAARNLGAKLARYDLILFLDADVECLPDTLKEVVKTYENNPELDACSGIVALPGHKTPFFPRYKSIRTYVYWMLENRGGKYSQAFGNACGSARREVFIKMGGFDESFTGASLEDSEFGSRLVAAGYKVGFNPKIRIKHRFEDFWPMVKKYVHRSRLWTRLFLGSKSFASAGMTQRESINGMLAACTLPFLVLGLLGVRLGWLGGLGFLGAHLIFARRFYVFVLKEAGLLFLLGTIPLQLFLYTVIYLASAMTLIEIALELIGIKRTPVKW